MKWKYSTKEKLCKIKNIEIVYFAILTRGKLNSFAFFEVIWCFVFGSKLDF